MSQTDLHIWQCLHSLWVQNKSQDLDITLHFVDKGPGHCEKKKKTVPKKIISVKSTELTGQPYCNGKSRLNAMVERERPGDVYNLV